LLEFLVVLFKNQLVGLAGVKKGSVKGNFFMGDFGFHVSVLEFEGEVFEKGRG
jgi:hypothetical protein